MMADLNNGMKMYPRYWLKRDNIGPASTRFSVMTYNVLFDIGIQDGHYEYCPQDKRYMNWRHKHIMVEIETMKPDVVCFQEVQESHWLNHLLPDMRTLGYDGVLSRREDDQGIAVCFRTAVFALQEHTYKRFHEVLEEHIKVMVVVVFRVYHRKHTTSVESNLG